jgi:ABC-type multidrug transport system, ATPase component
MKAVTSSRAPLPPEVFLRAEGLVKKFGDFVAVNGVSFDVPRGKVFGFLGPNGSGKSTTIRMLAGLLNPTSGTARGFDGLDVTDTERWKSRLGYMSQKFSLYLDLTVEENLRFFGRVYGLAGPRLDERIRELSGALRFERLRGPSRSRSPPACASASRSRPRSSTSRSSSSSTSRPAASTRRGGGSSGSSSTTSPPRRG